MRDVTADHVVTRDVPINSPIPHDVPIEIPRIIVTAPEPSPLARTPDERRFSASADWTKADVRGRIIRANKNGSDLATEDGREESFFPARLDAAGKVAPSEGMKDIVEPFSCREGIRQQPRTTFESPGGRRMAPEAETGVLEPPGGFFAGALILTGSALADLDHRPRSNHHLRRCPDDRRRRDLFDGHPPAAPLGSRPRRPRHGRVRPAGRPAS